MRIIHLCIIVVILLISISCCGNRCSFDRIDRTSCLNDTISGESFGIVSGKAFELKEDIDLGGKVCVVPMDATIKSKGGIIKNGRIVGQNTRVIYNGAVFDNITIEGSWIIPVIKSSLFKDLSYENSLKNVIALTNQEVHNKVIIYKGFYRVKTEINEDACLILNSNTEFILEGTIQIKPNDFADYDIIRIEGENIVAKGNGVIIGDKYTHLSKEGEWGMGIRVTRSNNVRITGLTIRECWGDCIYVGRGSINVTIKGCLLDHGRRQGISITSADSVTIKNCIITNVKGTDPEYAIDVEPNKGESVDNILISDVDVRGCQGGFLVYGKAPNAYVGKVLIKNCNIDRTKKTPISIIRCSSAKVEKCAIKGGNQKKSINYEEVGSVYLKNNKIE